MTSPEPIAIDRAGQTNQRRRYSSTPIAIGRRTTCSLINDFGRVHRSYHLICVDPTHSTVI